MLENTKINFNGQWRLINHSDKGKQRTKIELQSDTTYSDYGIDNTYLKDGKRYSQKSYWLMSAEEKAKIDVQAIGGYLEGNCFSLIMFEIKYSFAKNNDMNLQCLQKKINGILLKNLSIFID